MEGRCFWVRWDEILASLLSISYTSSNAFLSYLVPHPFEVHSPKPSPNPKESRRTDNSITQARFNPLGLQQARIYIATTICTICPFLDVHGGFFNLDFRFWKECYMSKAFASAPAAVRSQWIVGWSRE